MAQTYHKTSPDNEQEQILNDYLWETEVLPRLPADLAEQAVHHQAFQRKRGLESAADLLRGLLGYVLGGFSTRQWGAWATIIGLANISAQAWTKRLPQSGPWLAWLWHELVGFSPPPDLRAEVNRVLLIDASCLKQAGGTGDDWRLHLGYDLYRGELAQVHVSDRHQGEKLAHFAFQPGDLIVADRGYGYRTSLAHVAQAGAHGLFRFQPDKCPLETAAGDRFDVWTALPPEQPAGQLWDLELSYTYEQQRSPVRLVAAQLPQEQAARARHRLRERARKKGKTVSAKQLQQAGWLLLVTTLPASDWSAAELVQLYQARWQIELLFKRLKQMLQMHVIGCKCPASVEATIWALLVAWVLQEHTAEAIRAQLDQTYRAAQTPLKLGAAYQPLSQWSLNKLCVQTLKQQVLGQWSLARLQACLPQLDRYFRTKHRKRPHQATAIRDWLAQHSATDF